MSRCAFDAMADRPSIKGLANRLKLPQPMARRIAIADLSRRAGQEPQALEALLAHLPRETDHKALLRIVDAFGERRFAPAFEALAALRDNPDTAVDLAHAATIALDRIERADAPGSPQRTRSHEEGTERESG